MPSTMPSGWIQAIREPEVIYYRTADLSIQIRRSSSKPVSPDQLPGCRRYGQSYESLCWTREGALCFAGQIGGKSGRCRGVSLFKR
jgi:hypothetical protein